MVPVSGTNDLSDLRGEAGFEGDFGNGSEGALDYWLGWCSFVNGRFEKQHCSRCFEWRPMGAETLEQIKSLLVGEWNSKEQAERLLLYQKELPAYLCH